MLEAGAKVSRENCVGRTASQMAAFVGKFIIFLVNFFFKLINFNFFICIIFYFELEIVLVLVHSPIFM